VEKHIHVPMAVLQQQIRESIALQGFALRHVLASKQEPAFSYTVGLHRPGSRRPEIVISGLAVQTRVAWLLEIGFRIQGPPPLETCRQMARAQGVRLRDLHFPPGGCVFMPGKRYLDLAANGLPTCFAEVAQEHYATHFGQAQVFHGEHRFPVLQLVWSDPNGVFPWEDAFEQRWRDKQTLLFDPATFSLSE
jgi:hypothetical protein